MASLDMAPSADGLRAVIRKLGTAHAPPLQHSSVFANLCAPARRLVEAGSRQGAHLGQRNPCTCLPEEVSVVTDNILGAR